MGFNWRNDDTFTILGLMKEKHECLWNTKSKFYRNKSKRDLAKLSIIRQMKRPGLTVKDLDGKLKSIRSRYSTELNKVKDAEKRARISGDVDDLLIPRLSWYQLANSFLRDVTLSKKTPEDGGGGGEDSAMLMDHNNDDMLFEEYYQQHYHEMEQNTAANHNHNNLNASDDNNFDQEEEDEGEGEEEELEEKYEVTLDPESVKCEPSSMITETTLMNNIDTKPINHQQQSQHYHRTRSSNSIQQSQPKQQSQQQSQQNHSFQNPNLSHQNHYYHHSPSMSSHPVPVVPLLEPFQLEQSQYYPFAKMVASYLDQLPIERALISSCRIMNLLTEERLKQCRLSSNETGNATNSSAQSSSSINSPNSDNSIIQSTKMSSVSEQQSKQQSKHRNKFHHSSTTTTIAEITMPDFDSN